MNFNPNKLFFTMCELYATRVTKKTKLIVGNEGSSRSSKTWDFIHFLVAYCDHNRGNPKDIYMIRDTLVNCRDYTLKEFQDCLKKIGIYSANNLVNSPKPVYMLFGHPIKFRGLDDEETSEGYPSDIIFFNEVLECHKSGVMGLIMRCREMVVMDWNPKYTKHYIFDMQKRDDTVFTHSTYKQNRHLQASVIKEIESYNPWHPDDEHLDEDKRRPHPENTANGTADKYRWEVYGLGKRSNKEGLVFPTVTWVDAFPKDVEYISFGMDFGKTAQTAIVKCGIRIRKPKSDLFLQKLFYAPTESSDVVNKVLDDLKLGGEKSHLWADNNLPGWIIDLRNQGKSVYPTVKFPGSREYWITTLKRFKIHIVKDVDFQVEQENFSYRVLDGVQLSETIKGHDHLWSASGYSVVGDFRDLIGPEEVEEKKK